MKRYVCPKCGSQLMFWEEYVYDKEQLINARTGILNKRISNTGGSSCGTNGLKCTQCEFRYSGSDPNSNGMEYGILDEIFEKNW